MDGLTRRLLMIYEQGRIAGADEQFQVWGVDRDLVRFTDAYAGKIVDADTFKVHGERGGDWCEMVEVAWWINQDRDGCIYYVANPNTGVILRPSWREIQWMAQYANRMTDVSPKWLYNHWSTEERMAWTLMIGGDWKDTL